VGAGHDPLSDQDAEQAHARCRVQHGRGRLLLSGRAAGRQEHQTGAGGHQGAQQRLAGVVAGEQSSRCGGGAGGGGHLPGAAAGGRQLRAGAVKLSQGEHVVGLRFG
jgi:hypothetical protein